LKETDKCEYIAHELTHVVQHYGGFQSTWWVENMADYARFRYYHWLDEENVFNYFQNDPEVKDWGYEPYRRAEWFFAYLDERYPTTKGENGKITHGLIDTLHFAIQRGEIEDDGKKEHTNEKFNAIVEQITGYPNIEALRQRYVEELENGLWTFDGFEDYPDNFLTRKSGEVYPQIKETTPGTRTAEKSEELITEGMNLCSDASIFACSGFINDNEQDVMLIDGKDITKWCATVKDVQDKRYLLEKVPHYIIIDLGSSKMFDTYTILHAGIRESEAYNTHAWEVLVSENGTDWISVDYQSGNQENAGSYEIGENSGRYVMLKVWNPDESVGTVRIYEFMLFNKRN